MVYKSGEMHAEVMTNEGFGDVEFVLDTGAKQKPYRDFKIIINIVSQQ